MKEIKVMYYSLYVISNRQHLFNDIVRSLSPERVTYFSGSGYKSFSQLINTCVATCPTETVILMSDKVLPNQSHVIKTLNLLEKGFAFVGLYRFAFFGFKKELMRQIGMMDENYIGGGYEDEDFYIRLLEHNMSMYITHEVPYTAAPSSWNAYNNKNYHGDKWRFDPHTMTLYRKLKEPILRYDLGKSLGTKFLSCDEHSYISVPQVHQYLNLKVKSEV
jgi:hypothetical protein